MALQARLAALGSGATAQIGKESFYNFESQTGVRRVVRMVEAQVDPMEPPKFRHKKVPRGPPSPPAPLQRSPQRKLSVADQQAWKIPPAISNYKNPKGYTIPLDKRLAADGRGLQEVSVSDGFAKLSEVLYAAERNARDEVDARKELATQAKRKMQAVQEEDLERMARAAISERRAMRDTTQRETAEERSARLAREEMRAERRQDFQREQRATRRRPERDDEEDPFGLTDILGKRKAEDDNGPESKRR